MPLRSPVDNIQMSGEEANLDVVGLAFALSAILATFRCLRLARPFGWLDPGSDSWQGIEADETTRDRIMALKTLAIVGDGKPGLGSSNSGAFYHYSHEVGRSSKKDEKALG